MHLVKYTQFHCTGIWNLYSNITQCHTRTSRHVQPSNCPKTHHCDRNVYWR